MPDGVPDDVAAALLAPGITAHYLINSSYRVQPGETVLTYAGAGVSGSC
ncbi:NADPH2:quinone reductase [Arthrobacter sp. ok909]|nr:NADPH2:quinone reductase [Arthrobacter sp. ok909]